MEYKLNCIRYAWSPEMSESCFLDPGVGIQVVEDFVYNCEGASEHNLWGRVTANCSALHSALSSVNDATGRTSLGLPVPGSSGWNQHGSMMDPTCSGMLCAGPCKDHDGLPGHRMCMCILGK